MKPITLILLFVFSTSLFAQSDTLITNNDYKWKIGVKGILDRGIVELPPFGDRDISEERILFNYGGQFIYNLPIKFSSIEAGVSYIKRISYYEFLFPLQTNTNFLYVRKTFNNIHLPLKYRLDINFFYITIGGYMEYLISTSTNRDDLFNNTVLKDENYKPLNFGFTTSLGFEKHLTYTTSIFIEAAFSSNLTYLHEHQHRLQNYGLGMGLNFKIYK
ncbi:MAG: hypothetical protein RQ875_13960 [Vicingaceae bacterium]|nr:hypothetical protein [Vicingaceae bacterium]